MCQPYKTFVLWQATAHSVFANQIRKYSNDCFPGETPGGGDLRTLLATRTMQSVRCAIFDHEPYQFTIKN